MGTKQYPFDLYAEMERSLAEKHLRAAAHAANQRLREIEKIGRQESSAYTVAARAALARGKSGERARFPESYKRMTDREFQQTLRSVQKFMEAETSTLTGIAEVDIKVAKSVLANMEDRRYKMSLLEATAGGRTSEQAASGVGAGGSGAGAYGIDITGDLINFLKSEEFKRLARMYPSDELVEDFVAEVRKGRTGDEVRAEYREFLFERGNSLRELYEYRQQKQQEEGT